MFRRGMLGKRRAIFLDRDGVINRFHVEEGVTRPPASFADFQILPGVAHSIDRLSEAGFAVVVVTNQPDVARGLADMREIEAMHKHLLAKFPIAEVRVCIHDTNDDCNCRKPRPGMLTAAAEQAGYDLRTSYMIGDRWSDVVAGQSAGCKSILIQTPFSGMERCQPDHVADDLPQATDWILHSCADHRTD